MTATINKNGVLAGKVAVVTGASRGIGEAIAIRYAMEGAKVVVSARTLDDGDHILPRQHQQRRQADQGCGRRSSRREGGPGEPRRP